MAMYRNTISEKVYSSFEVDVVEGLSKYPKRLPSKYFYDDIGSKIFQEIMEMPTYYLTNCELEILQKQSADLYQHLGYEKGFSIVELGAGDGAKTRELLKYLHTQRIDVDYYPVDISAKAMELLEADLNGYLPELPIHPLVGDYFEVLDHYDLGEKPALFLFLGSNIGNYEYSEAVNLLQMIRQYMRPGDHLLIGFDLRKNPQTILKAYDDPYGITRRFNLNLLDRLNKELGANFETNQFDFYAYYDAFDGEVRSCIVSLVEQEVYFKGLDKRYQFQKNELLFTELSKKYDFREIETMAKECGFQPKQHFTDSRGYFSDSLFTY